MLEKNYWWVNQNKTWKQETEGGYMWSPKTNKAGRRSHYYDNMTRVKPGDIVYSYYNKDKNRAIHQLGIIKSVGFGYEKPTEIKRDWNDNGWKVNVEYFALDKPINIINHIDTLRVFLPDKYKPFGYDGSGLEFYLTQVPLRLAAEINNFLDKTFLELIEKKSNQRGVSLSKTDLIENEEIKKIQSDDNLTETEKESLSKSRRGQGKFKDDVIRLHKFCMFTKVANTNLLIASHIKPWAKSNNYERLDEYNGFPLTPTYDKLFDRGFISFNTNGGLLVSSRLKITEQEIFNIKNGSFNLTFLNERQEEYIKYHRENIFKN
jgi:hypothetical protein